MVEVGSSIVDVKSEHLRSESSDSFICISEDLPQSEKSHTSPERNGAGDWEYLKMAEVIREETGSSDDADISEEVVTPVKRDVGREWEGGDENSVTVERGGGGGGGEERGGEGEGREKTEEKEDSDWESWDD